MESEKVPRYKYAKLLLNIFLSKTSSDNCPNILLQTEKKSHGKSLPIQIRKVTLEHFCLNTILVWIFKNNNLLKLYFLLFFRQQFFKSRVGFKTSNLIVYNAKVRKVFLILSLDESEMSFLASGDLNLNFYRFVKF